MVPGVSLETSPLASSRQSNAVPCIGLTDEQALLTAGPIYQSVCSLIFSYLFHRFEYMFQKFISRDRVIQLE